MLSKDNFKKIDEHVEDLFNSLMKELSGMQSGIKEHSGII